MRRLLLFALAAATLAAAATGCTDPRSCQTDDDCFQGQSCTDQTCVGEVSTGDTGSTGRDTDPSTTDPDTGSDPDPKDTGSVPDDSGDPPSDTGGTNETGKDTAMRPLCEASASSAYCRNNSTEECKTASAHETDLKLGCWDTEGGPMDELVERLDQRHCLCNLSRGGDLRKDEFSALIQTAQRAGDDCPWKSGIVNAKYTFNIKGCNAEEMEGVTLRVSGNTPCPFKDQPTIDDDYWCQRDNEAGTLTLNWKANPKDAGGLPRLSFELYTSDRRLSFEYDLTATASVPE